GPQGQPTYDAVADGKVSGRRRRAGRVLRQDQARARDLLGEAPVLARVDHVDARAQHGQRPSPGSQASPMGRSVDPTGQAARDRDAALREIAGQPLGHLKTVERGVTRSDDRNRREIEGRDAAPRIEDKRGIGDLAQDLRVWLITYDKNVKIRLYGEVEN